MLKDPVCQIYNKLQVTTHAKSHLALRADVPTQMNNVSGLHQSVRPLYKTKEFLITPCQAHDLYLLGRLGRASSSLFMACLADAIYTSILTHHAPATLSAPEIVFMRIIMVLPQNILRSFAGPTAMRGRKNRFQVLKYTSNTLFYQFPDLYLSLRMCKVGYSNLYIKTNRCVKLSSTENNKCI